MPRKSSQASHQTAKRSGRRSSGKSRESILENPLNIDLRRFNGPGYKRILRDVYKNPISYLAGGVGAYMLGRFMLKYYKNHPEISEFIRENFESVEERLKEFRGNREEDYARH
jgi:hypothetical protein